MRKKEFLILLLILVLFIFGARKINLWQQDEFNKFSVVERQQKIPIIGFNSVIADFIFLNIQSLREQERYDEILPLANFMVELQPELTEVTLYLSHDLAFNISRIFQNYELRWKWVEYGINLLQNTAIKRYPAPEYFSEIAKIYRLRIAETLEPADMFFKVKLAEKMDNIIEGNSLENLSINQQDKLQKEFCLDYFKMQKIEHIFGKLDWRVADSLALYWAYLALEVAEDNKIKIFSYERSILSLLLRSINYGEILFSTDFSVQLSPNFAVMENAFNYFDKVLEKTENANEKRIMTGLFYDVLVSGLAQSFVYGKNDLVKKSFVHLRKFFPEEIKGKSINDLAINYLLKKNKNSDYRSVQTLLSGIYTKVFEYLLIGDVGMANNLERSAIYIYQKFKNDKSFMKVDREKIMRLDKIKLEVFSELQRK